MITADQYKQIRQELCRESFYDFIRELAPGYQFNFHHLILIQALQQLADGNIKQLLVMMPPRHGKSELVSRLFPAWMLARNPTEQIIAASYSADLAGAMSRDCQRVMSTEAYKDVFPRTKLAEAKDAGAIRTSKRFDIVGGKGYYLSAGVGGGITGAGCTVAIIDDPVKNAEEADSATYRNRAWEWYTTTFKTRFEPGCVEVICQTRWHEDDLTGRVLQTDVPSRVVLSMPALAEADDQYRQTGEALWEAKYNREQLLTIQKTIGTRAWNALYQQRPAAQEGDILKRSWFEQYDQRTLQLDGVVNFYFDTAYTDSEKNDPTAGIAYMVRGNNYYILECSAEYLDFNAAVRWIQAFSKRNGYTRQSVIRVEPKASGKSLVQVLKANTDLNIREAPVPKGDKVARVNSVSAIIEAGRVFVPSGMVWVNDFLEEVATFPNGAHDDRVDCLSGMLISEAKRGGLIASG
jgi:predicted phage terminase large subunit-like protein